MAREESDGVERLKRRLYARDGKTETGEERTPLSDEAPVHPPTSWDGIKPPSAVDQQPDVAHPPLAVAAQPKIEGVPLLPPTPEAGPGRSLAAKFLIGSAVFFIVASAAAAYMFFGGANLISPQNIDIEIVAPSLVDGGKETTLQVLIRNRNQTELQLADLIIDYPEGTRAVTDPSEELTHERISVGSIAPGEQIKHAVSAIFYGSEGVEQKIRMTLEYSVAGSNAVFEKTAEAGFTVGSSPVSLSISGPSEIIAEEQFTIEIQARSNTVSPVSDVVVQAQYPFGFHVADASPKAEAGGTFWRLGDMAPGTTKTIQIRGSIEGQDGDERVFRFLTGSVSDDTVSRIEVPFLVIPQTLTVREPFITSSITVDGKTGKNISVAPGTTVQGTVRWENNLREPLSNVELTLAFAGPALEKNSINSSNGFYQSSNSTIIWTREQNSALESIPPGESGTAQFSFSTQAPGSGGVLVTNPTIDLSLSVRGMRGSDSAPEIVSSAAATRVVLSSAPAVAAEAKYITGPFLNSGPLPPRAEAETTYTIIWTVKNPTNALANTVLSADLPPYVKFISAQAGAGIAYDDGSRTVRWNVGDLKAGVGYTLPVRQAAFQVALSPSTSQVGSAPNLTGETRLFGQDRFAQVGVNASAPAPTTALQESGFSSGMDIVGPKQ